MSGNGISTQMALSKLIREMENELANQVRIEITARRNLIARAVLSAEAVVRESYEATLRGLHADSSYRLHEDSSRPIYDVSPIGSRSPKSPTIIHASMDMDMKGPSEFVLEAPKQPVSDGYNAGIGTADEYNSGSLSFSVISSKADSCTPAESGHSSFVAGDARPMIPRVGRPGFKLQGPLEMIMSESETSDLPPVDGRPILPPSSRKPAMLRCFPNGASGPGEQALEASPVSLDLLIAQSEARNHGALAEFASNASFADKVNRLIKQFSNSISPEGASHSGFIIDDSQAWEARIATEFRNGGISASDTVFVKDSNGVVTCQMTAKDFASESRIPSLPPFPLHFTCSRTAQGNTCSVSTWTPSKLGIVQNDGLPAGLGAKPGEHLHLLEAPIREKRRHSNDGRRFSKIAQAIVGIGRMARSSSEDKFSDTGSNSCASQVSRAEARAEMERVAECVDFLPVWDPREDLSPRSPTSPTDGPRSPGKLERMASFESQDTSDPDPQWMGRRPSVTSIHTSYSDPTLYISQREPLSEAFWQGCILRPTSSPCILWDCWKSLFMVYDLVVIPLSAFSLPEHLVITVIDVIISAVWVLDVGMSFIRGYIDEKHGMVQMGARQVALRYIGTWFFFDVFVVTIDICILTMKNAIAMHGFVKLLPMLRLIRVMKLPSMLSMLTELLGLKASTEKLAFVFRILKLLIIFLFINHFISCGWYAIGQLGPRDGLREAGRERWVDLNFDEEATLGYRYTTSFHWSLTQFTPASMEVTPNNFVERLYNVVIIAVGFLMFSYMVSMMTQSISQLQQASVSERTALRQLRRFIADNNITVETVSKIMSFVHEDKKTYRRKKLHEEDVEALKVLPHALRRQIRLEIYYEVLLGHPLLEKVQLLHMACFKNLCHDCVYEKALMRGEHLFHFGMEGQGMYIITDGLMHYYLGYDRRVEEVVGSDRAGKLRICEASLWVRWVHRGRLVGEEPSEVIVVPAAPFTKICSHSNLVRHLKVYAMMFARRMVRLHGDSHYAKDTFCSDADAHILVESAFGGNQMVCTFLDLADPSFFRLNVIFKAWREVARRNASKKNKFFNRSGSSTSSLWSMRIRRRNNLFNFWFKRGA